MLGWLGLKSRIGEVAVCSVAVCDVYRACADPICEIFQNPPLSENRYIIYHVSRSSTVAVDSVQGKVTQEPVCSPYQPSLSAKLIKKEMESAAASAFATLPSSQTSVVIREHGL